MNIVDLFGFARDLGVRFTFVSFLPTVALALFALALFASGAPTDAPDLPAALERALDLDTWHVVALVFVVIVLALVLEPFQLTLVRILEGYIPGPLARWGRTRQDGKFRALSARTIHRGLEPTPDEVAAMGAAESQLRRRFPTDPNKLMPTALGNALRAAETGAGEPYGLDAVIIWPRLYPLLSQDVRALVDDQRDALDRAARFCVTFTLATLLSGASLAMHGFWLLVPLACAALARLSYRGAVHAALAYGEGIRSSVDLHRFDMLASLHLPLPATLPEERALNLRLSSFLRQGWPTDLVYDHSKSNPPADRS